MAPTKETLEGTTNDTAVSQANSRSKSPAMRADAVSLEVPVKVHGTRVSQAASGIASSEPFEEKTTTIIVFPQGGVLKMSTPVAPTQMMVVTNLKSGQDAICRVIKVRAFAPGQSYVEIEFTHRKAGYWGVYFPSDRAEAAEQVSPANQTVNAAPSISVDVKVEKSADKPTKERAAIKPAPTQQEIGKPAKKPDSVFAPIGSQEPVQPAAASTSSRVAPSSIGSIAESATKQLSFEPATKTPSLDVPAASTSSTSSSSALRENRTSSEPKRAISFAGAGVPGEVVDAPEIEKAEQTEPAPALGRFDASLNLDDEATARGDAFGSGLGSSSFGLGATSSESSHAKWSNQTILAIAAVVILVFAAGAAYRLHLFSPGHQSSAPSDSTTMPSAATATPQPMTQQPNSALGASASTATSALSRRTNAAAPAISSRPAEAGVAQTEKTEPKTPNLFAALKMHPKARKHARASAADAAAPDIDDAPVDASAALPAIAGSATIAPPPGAPQAPVRIRVGGAIKPPQLVSSAMPVYPTMARESGIDGDVVIDTMIDKTGKVASAKVISGPSMLRQAALDALRQWKYQPSLLNGDPVPVQMTVTIKFHRN
jgi:TonB family protein